jgi:hypothetical protein
MEAGKFSFKFSRQTQKNLVGSSKYAYFKEIGEVRACARRCALYLKLNNFPNFERPAKISGVVNPHFFNN